jgi:hypothetical protein
VAKRNAVAVHCPGETIGSMWNGAPAGHFIWLVASDGTKRGINYGCPCGCGVTRAFNFNIPGAHQWDGNEEKPSITPSLGIYPKDGRSQDGSGYHWHGYLRNGVFQEC